MFYPLTLSIRKEHHKELLIFFLRKSAFKALNEKIYLQIDSIKIEMMEMLYTTLLICIASMWYEVACIIPLTFNCSESFMHFNVIGRE